MVVKHYQNVTYSITNWMSVILLNISRNVTMTGNRTQDKCLEGTHFTTKLSLLQHTFLHLIVGLNAFH